MSLRQGFEVLCLLCAIAAVLVVSAFALAEDSFFFRSDLLSLLVVVTAAAAVVLVPLAGVFAGLWALSPAVRARPARHAALAFAASALGGFAYMFVAALDKEFRILGLLRSLDAEWLFVVLWALLVAGAWLLIARAPAREAVEHGASRLALVGAPLALAAFGLFEADAHLRPAGAGAAAAGGGPRHAVLVVLDGWPAQYQHPFNPAAAARPADRVFDSGRIFTRFRTSAAWTNGYFGALYDGTLRFTFNRPGPITQFLDEVGGGRPNLLSMLQDLGVRTRVMAFHRNGLPEGSASRVSDYRGFRSAFLTPRDAPLLDVLGLDYNLVIPGGPARTIWGDARGQAARRLLGLRTRAYDNTLTEVLLPQMRRLDAGGRSSFMVFHAGWNLGDIELPQMWDAGLPQGDQHAVTRRTAGRDYRYDPEDEWYARRMRERSRVLCGVVMDKIARFLAAAREAGLLDDTLVIFTADHGSMYARGRFAYGFHPDEEVLRVPFAVFGRGLAGREPRPFDTVDLVRTLIDYFGGDARLHPRARSALESADGAAAAAPDFRASATMRSDVNREWFLALYREGRKYLFNLHPRGDGAARAQTVHGFKAETVARGPASIRPVAEDLRRALDEYALADAEIHARFRRPQLRALAARPRAPAPEPPPTEARAPPTRR